MSVVAGTGAIAAGVGLAVVPGMQVLGVGLIGVGAATVAYGSGEVLESTVHINPVKDFEEQKLGMSESAV